MSKILQKTELRKMVKNQLDHLVKEINECLHGKNIEMYKSTLARVSQGEQLPHWYEQLRKNNTLPNLDGKTVGSVIEMLIVAILENHIFNNLDMAPLKVNPARGVDLPDLDLGVKSPSENYCTSEPYFSAYERLIGGDYDIIVLLTDYQTAKKKPPLKLSIIKWEYLTKTQIADANLCKIALKHRDWLMKDNESWAKKFIRFLSYVNQADWRARHILSLLSSLDNEKEIRDKIKFAESDFNKKNAEFERRDRMLIPDKEIASIKEILDVSPLTLGVIDCADNWVVETQKEAGRMPNDNEWERIVNSPLDGKIGMSFALQWRYNFGKIFNSPRS